MMKLDVPFYKQDKEANCGPTALKMILSYFGEDLSLEELERKSGIKVGKGLWTIQIATTAAKLGYKVGFFSKSLTTDEANFELDFYKKYAEGDMSFLQKLLNEAKNSGVIVEEKRFELDDLLSKLGENSLMIVLLDWNIVVGRTDKSYHGHFVPVVGFNEKNVIVHNQGEHEPQPFLEISRDVFDKARKAQGTDEDFLVVHRK